MKQRETWAITGIVGNPPPTTSPPNSTATRPSYSGRFPSTGAKCKTRLTKSLQFCLRKNPSQVSLAEIGGDDRIDEETEKSSGRRAWASRRESAREEALEARARENRSQGRKSSLEERAWQMMILYRRHKAGCAGCRCRKEKKRECHCCRCPIWAGGYFEGSRIRKSLDTGDWSKAQRSALNMEAQLTEPKKSEEAQEPTTIAKTQEMYLADAVKRGLRKATIDRHRIIFKQLQAFIEARGLKYLNQLTTERLTEF